MWLSFCVTSCQSRLYCASGRLAGSQGKGLCLPSWTAGIAAFICSLICNQSGEEAGETWISPPSHACLSQAWMCLRDAQKQVDLVTTGGLCWLQCDEHQEHAAAEIAASESLTSLLNFTESILVQMSIWNVFWSWKKLVLMSYLQGNSAAEKGVVPLKYLFPSIYIQTLYLKVSTRLRPQGLWYLCPKPIWLKSSERITPWHAARRRTCSRISPCTLPQELQRSSLHCHVRCYSWHVS